MMCVYTQATVHVSFHPMGSGMELWPTGLVAVPLTPLPPDILSVPLFFFIVRAAWAGRNRGPSHSLKGSVGSQIRARPLEVRVQAGDEHPWPWCTPFMSPSPGESFPLSPTRLPKDLGGGLCWLRHLPTWSQGRRLSWSPSGSSTWGWLVFCGGGVRDVQMRMYCGARWGGFGRVGGFLECLGFL